MRKEDVNGQRRKISKCISLVGDNNSFVSPAFPAQCLDLYAVSYLMVFMTSDLQEEAGEVISGLVLVSKNLPLEEETRQRHIMYG